MDGEDEKEIVSWHDGDKDKSHKLEYLKMPVGNESTRLYTRKKLLEIGQNYLAVD